MGGALSHFFQSGHALLSSGHSRGVSDTTRKNIRIVFDALRANPKVTVQRLEGLLGQIPRSENILIIHNEEGYHLLQKCVGINNVDMIRWCISRNIDINRGCCSLPLHIACLRGFEDAVELLLKHGARIDVEVKPLVFWKKSKIFLDILMTTLKLVFRSSDKLQCAIYYAIDGDQVDILELLAQQGEDHWLPWQQKRPLLHIACERGAWNCVKYLVSERSDEINQCYDEYYPIHQSTLHDIKFLELLIQCGAETTVRTSTQLMTALHVLLLQGKKSAVDTLQTLKLLLEHGLKEHINEPDSLGNTPLHALIVRYALEERRCGYNDDPAPWNKWDMLTLTRYLIQNGARPSINQARNSALACVLRHVTDWEFRYDLLNMLLQEGGDPNIEGRDGSVPLMVCLVPLINKDPLHHFSHLMKVCYLNCVRILCKYGANPNCSSRSNLTPLHVLVFTGTENISLARQEEKKEAFEFIRNLLTLLLQHGLDPNVRYSSRSHHILLSLMDMVQNARSPSDLNYVYSLTLTLLQYGANPNMTVNGGSGKRRYSSNHSRAGDIFMMKSSHQVLFHYCHILINKDKLLWDPDQTYTRLIRLYFLSMKSKELYHCLFVFSAPRTLKQMCRVEIYNMLGQRPAVNVSKLPLPPVLREYLLNFEP
ncbi:ankyrin-3 [Eurytemora carolleeae]|uniref:ankyrin-3 n=1 Tax=Eurytemora carolleeae TaxID=1294199 RepID=UPI000C75C3E6|nr:ankyrin-3 [Eurytemora carolleeae]|eukprot:XP_023338966.1 ankyrin-3-like [Eurytemora affinis]